VISFCYTSGKGYGLMKHICRPSPLVYCCCGWIVNFFTSFYWKNLSHLLINKILLFILTSSFLSWLVDVYKHLCAFSNQYPYKVTFNHEIAGGHINAVFPVKYVHFIIFFKIKYHLTDATILESDIIFRKRNKF
jgi:hypothetical protein